MKALHVKHAIIEWVRHGERNGTVRPGLADEMHAVLTLREVAPGSFLYDLPATRPEMKPIVHAAYTAVIHAASAN